MNVGFECFFETIHLHPFDALHDHILWSWLPPPTAIPETFLLLFFFIFSY
jgi:hypothetical protein